MNPTGSVGTKEEVLNHINDLVEAEKDMQDDKSVPFESYEDEGDSQVNMNGSESDYWQRRD